jgi:hypothetical protein
MKVTRKIVAQKIIDYLHHSITQSELVDWAESMMMDADFATEDFETLWEIVSRLGVADVKAFGMTWDDCQKFLSRLGYQARVMVTESSVNAAVRT